MKLKLIALLLILSAFALKAYASDEVNFTGGSYADVLAKAKAENKTVMIDFFTDWCKWCVELDKKVYTNPEVAGFANTYQINWKIDAEKGEGVDLAKKYNVSGYPTIVFVDANGDEVDRIIGYLPAKDFLALMKEFAEGKTVTSLKKGLESNPNDIEANLRLGKRSLELGNIDDAKKYLGKVTELDPKNEKGFTDDAEIYIAQISNNIENIAAVIKKYPESNLAKQANLFLAEISMENNDYAKADEYYKNLISKYGKTDEDVSFSYGQYLITKMYALTKKADAKETDYKNGIVIANECLDYVKGSINESSCYFYMSEFYLKLGDKKSANENIDKALQIHDKKAFRDQKEKINK
jgi:thioredoxin-related protein/predicted negative regulator of RcsB-dependent stress response